MSCGVLRWFRLTASMHCCLRAWRSKPFSSDLGNLYYECFIYLFKSGPPLTSGWAFLPAVLTHSIQQLQHMNIKPADCSHAESSEFHREKKYEESALHHTTIILINITLQVTARPIYMLSRCPGRCTRFFPSPAVCLCVSLYLSGFLLLWCHTCESLLWSIQDTRSLHHMWHPPMWRKAPVHGREVR